MDNNKVSVKIYGNEYILAGEASKEEIVQTAAHVDMKMNEIAEGARAVGATTHNVAILAAINITKEYFQNIKEIEDLRSLNIRLEKDAQHYVQMWDESKKNYEDYKAENQATIAMNDALKKEVEAKNAEIESLKAALEASKAQIENSESEAVQAAEDKCRELENSFFDLQMENLQLKKDLEKYKNSIGKF
ncbi:MAG: cell division protein ZapA [Firmicutes bacterium]|nr:cell division protein ZapA [Bacillota bacterium]